jgi:hypothetical protein
MYYHIGEILCCVCFAGFELTFFSGVYGTCIAQNKHFGDNRKGLLGISGMLIGAGEIVGQYRIFSPIRRYFLFRLRLLRVQTQ